MLGGLKKGDSIFFELRLIQVPWLRKVTQGSILNHKMAAPKAKVSKRATSA